MSTRPETPRRSTKQRAAIVRMLSETSSFHTAQELHDRLRAAGHKVALTTVYRALQALAAEGEVDVLVTGSGESIYRRCSSEEHHHHLVCRRCGHSVEIESQAVEDWAARTASEHGYSRVTHTAEVYGECAACAAR